MGVLEMGLIYFIYMSYLRWKYRFIDEELCMCGSMYDEHGYSDNHGFVGAKQWTIDNEFYWWSVGGKL
jgi:hypothetical protein